MNNDVTLSVDLPHTGNENVNNVDDSVVFSDACSDSNVTSAYVRGCKRHNTGNVNVSLLVDLPHRGNDNVNNISDSVVFSDAFIDSNKTSSHVLGCK